MNAENSNGSEPGRRFFLGWMLAFLGFPLGGALALVVVGPIDGVLSAALSGVLAGAVIGAAQWLVLRGCAGIGPSWIVATALGVAVGDATGAALTGAGTQIGDLLVTGVAAGVAVGFLQWTLWRGRARGAGLWPLVVTTAWPLGWTVTWAVGVDVERGYAVFGSSGALVYAAITGTAMWLVLRVPVRPGRDA